jgi:diguanylate cyclase
VALLLFILFIMSIGFIIFFFIYDYFRGKNQDKRFENKLTIVESELKESKEAELRVRDEINILQNKLRHTLQDPITNLLGWQLFEDRLNQNIKESQRYQLTLGIMYVDIDDFKMINDALSYETGNGLLKEVAERLQSCVRKVDSVSRFAKDTFVILLTQLAKPETAAMVAQRILQSLAQPFQINGNELFITAGIGISIYPTDGPDAATLLRNADHALHLAKEKGKHGYQFSQEKMHIKSQRELAITVSLNRGSFFQEFVLYYNPIVNVKDETIFCMDALLHWQHPDLGLIGPQELLNFAEKQRNLNSISEWLLKNACKQFLHWRSLGFNPQYLGIPLSLKQLENSHFIYRISQLLQDLEFKPEWMLFEIKETFAQLSFEVLEKAFNMLTYLGVNIAIDDFGSGPFSLYQLKNFAVNYLKLDASFVKDITTDPQTVALVKSVIFLSKKLSMQLIIQGIETEEQKTILKELDCILMQGKLLGEPLSEREVTSKMGLSE